LPRTHFVASSVHFLSKTYFGLQPQIKHEKQLIGLLFVGNGWKWWQAEIPLRLIALVQASQAFGGTKDRLSFKWGAQQI
jgi:hypothetical protein